MESSPIRAELRVQTVCMATLTVVAVGFALYWLQPVMIPFVVSAFLAFALRPLIDVLETYAKVPRGVAACLMLLLAVMVLAGLGVFVSVSIDQAALGPNQNQDAQQPADEHEHPIASQYDPIASQYERQLKKLLKSVTQAWPLSKLGIDSDQALQYLSQFAESLVKNVLVGVPKALVGVVSQSALVLVFLFFLLLGSVKREQPIGGAWGEVESQIRTYLITMTAIAGVTGALVGGVLAMLGVPAAALFGLLAFLLNFIPSVGSMLATVLPLPVVWLSPEFTLLEKILAIAIPGAIQFGIGNFIQPKIMGNSMKLHPVVILMALIFWGMLWGIVGMFLAVPITSIIRITCDRHDLTKRVVDLMAGKLDAFREDAATPPT